MPTPSIETARAWLRRVMVDRDGNTIGEVTDIYLDNRTGQPDWAVVRTGLFGLRASFVPLAGAVQIGDQVQVPYRRLQVKDAPNIEPDGHLSPAEEVQLYRHYGLDDPTVRAGDAPAGAGEPGRLPDREPAGTGADGEPGAGQGRSAVGEGTSRPFVYETPGWPEAGAAGGHGPGRVRLVRYVVTEVVTDTESGQRHELRVEREPAADAAGTGQGAESSGEEPAGRDGNDWFHAEDDPPR